MVVADLTCPGSSETKSPDDDDDDDVLTLLYYKFLLLCSAPQMRRGGCWPLTWTGIPPITDSTTAVSSTSCCHMASLCLIGWSSLTRWEMCEQGDSLPLMKCVMRRDSQTFTCSVNCGRRSHRGVHGHVVIWIWMFIKTWWIDVWTPLVWLQTCFPWCTCCLLQAVDAPSLLRLYLNFDLLEPAAELVLEYVDALLGRGHQYFGIEVHVMFIRRTAASCTRDVEETLTPVSVCLMSVCAAEASVCDVVSSLAAVHVDRPAASDSGRDSDQQQCEWSSLPVWCYYITSYLWCEAVWTCLFGDLNLWPSSRSPSSFNETSLSVFSFIIKFETNWTNITKWWSRRPNGDSRSIKDATHPSPADSDQSETLSWNRKNRHKTKPWCFSFNRVRGLYGV